MVKVIYTLFVFLPFLTFAQDTIPSKNLIRVLNDSVYIIHYNGKPFSGIQKKIGVFDWDVVHNPNQRSILIPKEDWADTIRMKASPSVNGLKPHEYAISYIEFNHGIRTGNSKTFVNNKTASLSKVERNKKTQWRYHFNKGDTVPKNLKSLAIWKNNFVIYYVSYSSLEKLITEKKYSKTKSYNVLKSKTFTDSTFKTSNSRGRRTILNHYYLTENKEKGKKNLKQTFYENHRILVLEYNENGKKIKKTTFWKARSKQFKNGGFIKKLKEYN